MCIVRRREMARCVFALEPYPSIPFFFNRQQSTGSSFVHLLPGITLKRSSPAPLLPPDYPIFPGTILLCHFPTRTKIQIQEDLSSFADELEVPIDKMKLVFDASQDLVKRALYAGISTSEEALSLMNDGEEAQIDGRLKTLIAQVSPHRSWIGVV